jgi:hypothetical protein
MGCFLLAILGGTALLIAEEAMPQMKSVDPDTAKAGDVLTVTGENLDQSVVAEVYLTDGTHDFKAAITQQETGSLKVKVSAATKPGRLALMVLTKGKVPKLIEQPVKVNIE